MKIYTILSVFAVDLLAAAVDSIATWSSPIIPKLHSPDPNINPLGRPINITEETWIGSLVNIGAIIGPLFFGYIAEMFGRKVGLLTVAVPQVIACFILAFSGEVYLYYSARLIAGMTIGGGYALLPMYIAEISDVKTRGRMSVTLNVFWNLGGFIPYCIGPYMSIQSFNLTLLAIPISFFVIFLSIAPETPYFLVKHDKVEQAGKLLRKLRHNSDEVVKKELEDIVAMTKNEKKVQLTDLVATKSTKKALLISIVLIMSNQLSGINAFLFYLQPIFEASGSEIPADFASVVVGFVLFVSSFILPFIADKVGRKILLIISSFGMCFFLFIIGSFFYLRDNSDFYQVDLSAFYFIPIVCLIFYIILFNLGMGPLPWTVSSELFPSNIKSTASSIMSMTCWTISFLVTKFFPHSNEVLGRGPTFWIFGGFSFLAGMFCVMAVPETNRKTFTEIQEMLEK